MTKNKKATKNPKNIDDKCFQYAVTLTLNNEQIKKDPLWITKIKPFFDQYNWNMIFHQIKKSGKSLNWIINQLLLIYYMYLVILNK